MKTKVLIFSIMFSEFFSLYCMEAPPIESSRYPSSIQSSVQLLQNPCETSESYRALMEEIFPQKYNESFMKRLMPAWYEDKKSNGSAAKYAIFDHNACLLWRLSILYGKSFKGIPLIPQEAIEINKVILKSISEETIEADGGALLFKGHIDSVTAVSFNPESTILITGSADKNAIVWKLTENLVAPQARLIGHNHTITCIAINNQDIVLAGSENGTICLWNLSKNESLKLCSLGSPLMKINFYPHSTIFLAQVSSHSKLFLGDLSTLGDLSKTFTSADQFNHSLLRGINEQDIPLLPTSQNNYILFSSKERTAKLYSLETNKLDTTSSLRQQIQLVDISNNKKLIYTTKDTHKSYLLDLKESRRIELEHQSQKVTAVAISPIGVFAATGSDTGMLKIWSLSNFDCLEISLHSGAITAIAVSPNGRYIATASADKTVRLYDLFALNSFLNLDIVMLIWYLHYKKSTSNEPIKLSENQSLAFRKMPEFMRNILQREYSIVIQTNKS